MFPECKKDMPVLFVLKSIPGFFDTFIEHHASMIVQREKSHLPATQIFAQNYNTYKNLCSEAGLCRKMNSDLIRKLEVLKIKKLILTFSSDDIKFLKSILKKENIKAQIGKHKVLRKLNSIRNLSIRKDDEKNAYEQVVEFWESHDEDLEDLKEMEIITRQTKEHLAAERKKLEFKYRQYNQDTYSFSDQQTKQESVYEFTFKCPYPTCLGYVSQGKCGLCNRDCCTQCLCPLGQDHKCDPSNLSTAKLIKSDTKPCPKCKTLIHKISGCYQMWCTQCHTAFHWRTGEICTGRLHNPHYIQWVSEGKEDVEDQKEDFKNTYLYVALCLAPFREKDNFFAKLLQCIYHILDVERDNYQANGKDAAYLKLRVKYLANEIDEKKWISEIRTFEKKQFKKQHIWHILEMFVSISGNTISNMLASPQYITNINEVIKLVISILTYSIDQIKEVCKLFHLSTPDVLRLLRETKRAGDAMLKSKR